MRARRQEYGEHAHGLHLPSTSIEHDASSSSSSSLSCRVSLSVVVLFILLGASLMAFEEEVSALLVVKDIKRGIQRVHARVLAPRKAAGGGAGGGGGARGSPLARTDDGDGVVKGTVPSGWGRADAKHSDNPSADPKSADAEDTTLGTRNDGPASTTDVLEGARDAVKEPGATEFFSWRRVEPDCEVGDAEAIYTANQIRNATLRLDPYPHLQVYDIFPDRLYACIVRKIPPGDGAYTRLKEGVDRFMVSLYDRKRAAKGKSDKAWDALNGKGRVGSVQHSSVDCLIGRLDQRRGSNRLSRRLTLVCFERP